jgi:hypothetical protein
MNDRIVALPAVVSEQEYPLCRLYIYSLMAKNKSTSPDVADLIGHESEPLLERKTLWN